MTVVVIADEETCTGFKLIGCQTHEVTPEFDFSGQLRELIDNPDVRVVIIGEEAFLQHKKEVIDYKKMLKKPLILPIPDIFGDRLGGYVEEILKNVVGIV